MPLRYKTKSITHYGGNIDNVFKLSKTSNIGKIFYFNFESLSDVSSINTVNLFSTTASGVSGNNFIDLTSGQTALNFTYQDAYITIEGNSYIIQSVNEATGRITLYSNLINTFTNSPILFNSVSATALINRFTNIYNSYTGSGVWYIYKIDNLRWTLRGYANVTNAVSINFNVGNSNLPSTIRRFTSYNDFRLKKFPYSNDVRIAISSRGNLNGSSFHTIEQGSGYNNIIGIVPNIANQAFVTLSNDKGEFLLPRKYANIFGLIQNENNSSASGNRVLVSNDVVSTRIVNGIAGDSSIVSYSRDTTTLNTNFTFYSLNIGTSPLYSVYTEFSFILGIIPVEDYTIKDINRHINYIRNILKVY